MANDKPAKRKRKRRSTNAGRREADPLASVVITRLRRELDQAREMAEGDLASGADAFRDLLADLLDRVDGWLLTRDATSGEVNANAGDDAGNESAATTAMTRCAATALGGRAPQPVTEWLLIPFGEVAVERPLSGEPFEFTRQHAESARRWFERLDRKLAIDYEHQSIEPLNSRPDGLRPAAGWIGGLEIRDDGLWAVDVSWTPRAVELLSSGEYLYFSPVIYWSDEDKTDLAALGPVALTNDPAMHGVQPLAARRRGAESEADESEVELLRRQIRATEADAFVERGMRLGKILDSTSMDWRDDYLRDAEAAEARLSRSPVILPPGRVTTDRDPGRASRTHSQRQYAAHADVYRRWGVEVEDLEAFERAEQDGRIHAAVPLS
jgi:hypothetical protein